MAAPIGPNYQPQQPQHPQTAKTAGSSALEPTASPVPSSGVTAEANKGKPSNEAYSHLSNAQSLMGEYSSGSTECKDHNSVEPDLTAPVTHFTLPPQGPPIEPNGPLVRQGPGRITEMDPEGGTPIGPRPGRITEMDPEGGTPIGPRPGPITEMFPEGGMSVAPPSPGPITAMDPEGGTPLRHP